MTISPLVPGSIAARRDGERFREIRETMADLQRQMSTGKRSDTFAGLGFDRRVSLDARSKIAGITGHETAITDANLRLKFLTQGVETIAKVTSEAKGDVPPLNGYVLGTDGRTSGQKMAEERLKQSIDILNTDLNGRYLYSGRTSDVKPVIDFNTMMNGDGTRAGLRDLIAQRKAADLGATGLGRTLVGAAGTSVMLTEEAAGLPFGFKIAGVSATGSAIATTQAAGPPAMATANLTGLPADGDTLTFILDLPDGTQERVSLVARANPQAGATENSFQIGATPAATAANLSTALTTAMQKAAAGPLAAASAMVASESFFAGTLTNPPVRVAGPPYDTATTTVAGTTANTVVWYRGDDAAGSARDTAPVRIDATQSIGLGARANEPAFQRALSQFAALAAESFSTTVPTDQSRYEALAGRIRTNLSFTDGTQKVQDIAVELGNVAVTLKAASDRHTATKSLLEDALGNVEDAPIEEVAASLLAMQTRLEASYQVTSILSRLSLTNYL
jgi:flagellin-like hook-associated protein FlgL